jgi:exopolyphosphatase/guanosine-5'-triphosphate,3'-diphosphate pyrophosphatase
LPLRRCGKLRTAATSAARTVGIDIEVISPEEEAELALRSVASNFELGDEPVAVVDIGGGSMEIVITTGGAVSEVRSLPLGAVRLTERFVKSDPITDGDWDALRDETDRELAAAFGGRPQLVSEMIGSGGTFTTLEVMTEAGPAMTIDDIEKQALLLRALSLGERQRVQGLPPARADIILAGTAVVLQTARCLQAARIRVNHSGIRDGIILEMISRLSP